MRHYTSLLCSKKWSGDETLTVIGGFEPLVQGWRGGGCGSGDDDYSDAFGGWEVMRGPSVETGVGQETLRRMGVIGEGKITSEGVKALQRIIWQSADVSTEKQWLHARHSR